MIFEQIDAGGDRNFAYLIGDDSTGEAAIVDPSYAPELALDHATRHGLSVRYVISTHSHPDHVAGNAWVLERTKASEVLHESSPHPSDLRVRDNGELAVISSTCAFFIPWTHPGPRLRPGGGESS